MTVVDNKLTLGENHNNNIITAGRLKDAHSSLSRGFTNNALMLHWSPRWAILFSFCVSNGLVHKTQDYFLSYYYMKNTLSSFISFLYLLDSHGCSILSLYDMMGKCDDTGGYYGEITRDKSILKVGLLHIGNVLSFPEFIFSPMCPQLNAADRERGVMSGVSRGSV